MISTLSFGAAQRAPDGRLLRVPAFVRTSTLPLSAACLVANGVRERLSHALATELDVDLVEPAIPDADERRVLLDAATIFRVRGRICDGFVIVRPTDARRIVALAFGESGRPDGDPLSDIERATVERVIGSLLPLCNTLCGTLGSVTPESGERATCDLVTYFEVRTTGKIRISIGFALTRDPAEDVAERITLDDIADVEIEGVVELGTGALRVPAFSRLAAGASLVLDTPLAAAGTLRFGDVTFARGTCGVTEGRSAIAFPEWASASLARSGAAR